MQGPVDALIHVLYTQTFAEDQIEDAREHAYSKNFRRHGGTHFQKNGDLTDCHPCSSFYPFDHNSAAALAVVFEAPVPEATRRFPRRGTIFSVGIISSLSLCSNVSNVVCLLVVLRRSASRSCRCLRLARDLFSSTKSVRSYDFSPFVSLYFVPWSNSPLIHLHATLLSPQKCTVDPSSRV